MVPNKVRIWNDSVKLINCNHTINISTKFFVKAHNIFNYQGVIGKAFKREAKSIIETLSSYEEKDIHEKENVLESFGKV